MENKGISLQCEIISFLETGILLIRRGDKMRSAIGDRSAMMNRQRRFDKTTDAEWPQHEKHRTTTAADAASVRTPTAAAHNCRARKGETDSIVCVIARRSAAVLLPYGKNSAALFSGYAGYALGFFSNWTVVCPVEDNYF